MLSIFGRLVGLVLYCLYSLFLSFYIFLSFFRSFFLSFLCPSSLHRTLCLAEPQIWLSGLISYYVLPADTAVINCMGIGSLGCALQFFDQVMCFAMFYWLRRCPNKDCFSSMVHPHTLSYQDLVSRALVGQIWAFHVNSFHHVSDGLCQTHIHTPIIPFQTWYPYPHATTSKIVCFASSNQSWQRELKPTQWNMFFWWLEFPHNLCPWIPISIIMPSNIKQCMAIWRVYIAYVRHGTQFDYYKILVTLRHSDPSCWAIPLLINIFENKSKLPERNHWQGTEKTWRQ